MKVINVAAAFVMPFVCMLSAYSQGSVVINEPSPSRDLPKIVLSDAEQRIMDTAVLPKARVRLADEACEESIDLAARLQGAFTKLGAKQTLIFYQFCQTGNGLGSAGVAIIEGSRLVGNFVSPESGWTLQAAALPDIDQNGLNEIALYYSGGMHQGGGGTGVDIMQFSSGGLKGIGWFQAEEYSETSPVYGYKVTVNPGKTPAYFREKYTQSASGKWRKTGRPVPLKLQKVSGAFEALK